MALAETLGRGTIMALHAIPTRGAIAARSMAGVVSHGNPDKSECEG